MSALHLDFDLLVQLTRLGPITINPLDGLTDRPLTEVLGPFARGQAFDQDHDGRRWRVYPLRVPSGLGFGMVVKVLGDLQVAADEGRVRLTLPAPLALLVSKTSAWPVEGPQALPDGRADVWLHPTRGEVATVGQGAFGLGLRAA